MADDEQVDFYVPVVPKRGCRSILTKFGTERVRSHVTLVPQQLPPSFKGEVRNRSLTKNVVDGFRYGKIVDQHYLLHELSIMVMNIILVFGDAMSDVYMSFEVYYNPKFKEIPQSAKRAYVTFTFMYIAFWFMLTTIIVLNIAYSYINPRDSKPRRLGAWAGLWLSIGFNVPYWILNLPKCIVKTFRIADDDKRRNQDHFGFIYGYAGRGAWKGSAHVGTLVMLPAIILEDCGLLVLNFYIMFKARYFNFQSISALFFSMCGSALKLPKVITVLRACINKDTVDKETSRHRTRTYSNPNAHVPNPAGEGDIYGEDDRDVEDGNFTLPREASTNNDLAEYSATGNVTNQEL